MTTPTQAPAPTLAEANSAKVRRRLYGGVLAGGSLAATLGLLAMAAEAKRVKKLRQAEKDETVADTIVLTLPASKTAGCELDSVTDVAPKPKLTSHKQLLMPRQHKTKAGNVEREVSGVFASPLPQTKTAGTLPSWMYSTASMAALLAGAYGGYRGIKAIQTKLVEDRAKAEAELARQEYLDKLQTLSQKQAQMVSVSTNPEVYGNDKVTDTFNDTLGLGGLALLSTIFGSALLTKRFLDSESPEVKSESTLQGLPKVKRVIFKTETYPGASARAEVADPAKPPVQELEESAPAQLSSAEKLVGTGVLPETAVKTAEDKLIKLYIGAMVYKDIISGEPTFLGNEKVAAAIAKAGLTPVEIIKQAANDDLTWLDKLAQQTWDTRSQGEILDRVAMLGIKDAPWYKRPFIWLNSMPGVQNTPILGQALSNTVRSGAHEALFGPRQKPGQMQAKTKSKLPQSTSRHGYTATWQPTTKTGAAPILGLARGVAGNLGGGGGLKGAIVSGVVAGTVMDNLKDKDDKPVTGVNDNVVEPDPEVAVEAADAQAQDFINRNRDIIERAVRAAGVH